MYRNLDSVERMIIAELSRNSRLPHTALAKKCGVSAVTIRKKLKGLTGRDVINLRVILNYQKLGYQTAAFIGLNVRPSALTPVLATLQGNAKMPFIVLTAGRYNVLLLAIYESPSALSDFLEKELSLWDGILRTETLINFKVIKRPWDDLLEPRLLRTEVDILDRQIISALDRDVRLSYAKIAHKVGASVPTVRQRLGHLVNGGVVAFSLFYYPPQLGHQAIAIMGLRVRPSRLQEVQNYLGQKSEVRYMALTAGRYDFVMVMSFKAATDLARFLRHDLASFDGIEQVETFTTLEIVKRSFTGLFQA